MGEIVDFQRVLRDQRLRKAQETINSWEFPTPKPETFGWVSLEEIDGKTVRYFNDRYKAYIGYVPGYPVRVYLDYKHKRMSFSGYDTLAGLAVDIEMGTLPDPDHIVE